MALGSTTGGLLTTRFEETLRRDGRTVRLAIHDLQRRIFFREYRPRMVVAVQTLSWLLFEEIVVLETVSRDSTLVLNVRARLYLSQLGRSRLQVSY